MRMQLWCCVFLIFTIARLQAEVLNANWKVRDLEGKINCNAIVPGNIWLDLSRHGVIKNPMMSGGASDQWIDTTTWIYETTIDCENYLNKKFNLTFNGLDTYANVYLNDSLILTCANSFRKFKVQGLSMKEHNSLRISFNAVALGTLNVKNKNKTLPGGDWAFCRKPAFQFGWDFAPRMLGCGITDRIEIKADDDWNLEHYQVTHDFNKNDTVTIKLSVEGSRKKNVDDTFILSDTNGNKIAEFHGSESMLTAEFKINQPLIWWCNGFGKQPIYQYRLEHYCDSLLINQFKINFGIRTIKLNKGSDSIGNKFSFNLNGKDIFIKGANYVPSNFFLKADSIEIKKLLISVKDAGMNMLRIWGGGRYEADYFYHLCDSLGIMLWHDYMFAGSLYPADSIFLKDITVEIKNQVSRLQKYCSIVLWCGNNEVDEAWHNWGWQKGLDSTSKKNYWEAYTHLFQSVIPDTKQKIDSITPYVSTSPAIGWGKKESMRNYDSHYWGVWWGKEPFEIFTEKIPRFMSEYGMQALPNISSIIEFNKDISLDSAIILHQRHPTGGATIQHYLDYYKLKPASLSELSYATQYLQYRALATAYGSHQLASEKCSGSLYWQLNDCWPAISWSSIDYFNQKKMSYYAIKKMYNYYAITKRRVNNRLEIDLLLDTTHINDLQLLHYTTAGELTYHQSVAIKPKHQFSFPTLNISTDTVAILQINYQADSLLNQINLLLNDELKVNWQAPQVKYQIVDSRPGSKQIKIITDKPVFGLQIDTGIKNELEDNFLMLLPKQEVIINVKECNNLDAKKVNLVHLYQVLKR
ncbi:MAG: hypothetical protein RIQ89_1499 [Bacteroidota bacterium]